MKMIIFVTFFLSILTGAAIGTCAACIFLLPTKYVLWGTGIGGFLGVLHAFWYMKRIYTYLGLVDKVLDTALKDLANISSEEIHLAEAQDRLWRIIDIWHAYDNGTPDIPQVTENDKSWATVTLRSMGATEKKAYLSRKAREVFLSEEAISHNFSIEDVANFWNWTKQKFA